jgi:prolyl 4-hydroxylase
MRGCGEAYSDAECESTEVSRLKMSREQPANQYNYTEIGFKKIKAPKQLYALIKSFYDRNKHKRRPEQWGRGYTYTNHWVAPTFMVSTEDTNLEGAGNELKAQIWEGIRPIIEEWTGHKIKPTSLYGVRVYTDGAILATHVDRLPLVSSCIINVDQDVREPWPIEVYDHAGKAHNVTMEPGDVVLYESHTVLHGRPAPLNGSFYANLFVHFEPLDHKEMNDLMRKNRAEANSNRGFLSNILTSGKSSLRGAPKQPPKPPVIEVEEEEEEFDEEFDMEEMTEEEDKRLQINFAAASGNLNMIKSILAKDINAVHTADRNKWQPIHEAVRAGHTAIVKYLVDMGADIGALTGSGSSPLWYARRFLPKGHSTISYLEEIGAPDEGGL